MAPEIVQGPNPVTKVIHPSPLGSKNISFDSFPNTLKLYNSFFRQNLLLFYLFIHVFFKITG